MKNISKKAVAFLVVLVIAFGCVMMIFNINTALADTARTVESYTETDKFYINGFQHDIQKYAESMEDNTSNLYASSMEIMDNFTPVRIKGDDPITEIIPKEYFTTAGKQIVHVGDNIVASYK